MPLFPDTPVADFSNRLLDTVVSESLRRFGSEHPDLLRGARLGVSVVDLSTAAQDPPYGGLNDTSEYFVASLAKIGPMYASYQLRSYVREEATKFDGIKEELLNSVEQKLTPQVESQLPSFRKDHPALTKIFDVRYNPNEPGFIVNFSSTGQNDDYLDSIDEMENQHSPAAFSKTRELGFKERIQLMIKWSSNCAACTCIKDLGFQYLNGLLRKAGLFDSSSSKGLWLGADYAGSCTGATAGERRAVGDGRVTVVNKHDDNEVFQVATSRSVARMLRAIAELKLVDPEASCGIRDHPSMQALLDKGSSHTSSPIGAGLTKAIKVYSKLGIGGSTVCDCALVLTGDRISGPISYIAVILGAPNLGGQSRDFNQIARSIVVMAPYLERGLLERHT